MRRSRETPPNSCPIEDRVEMGPERRRGSDTAIGPPNRSGGIRERDIRESICAECGQQVAFGVVAERPIAIVFSPPRSYVVFRECFAEPFVRYRDERDSVGVFGVEAIEDRHLLLTGDTPRREEIDDRRCVATRERDLPRFGATCIDRLDGLGKIRLLSR